MFHVCRRKVWYNGAKINKRKVLRFIPVGKIVSLLFAQTILNEILSDLAVICNLS